MPRYTTFDKENVSTRRLGAKMILPDYQLPTNTYSVSNSSGTVLILFDSYLDFLLLSKMMVELVRQSRPLLSNLLDVVCRQFLVLNTDLQLLDVLSTSMELLLCRAHIQ